MKEQLITAIIIFALSRSCFCMENILKMACFQYSNRIYSVEFGPKNKILFFTTEEEKTHKKSLELYDTSAHKKIKTIHDIYQGPYINQKNPYRFALRRSMQNKVDFLYDFSKNTKEKFTINIPFSVMNTSFLLDETKLLIAKEKSSLNIYDIESNSKKSIHLRMKSYAAL